MSLRPEPIREVSVQREHAGAVESATDQVAEERPVALHYYRLPYVVMLASPADLEDFGVGFTLSEGIVGAADEIRGVELVRDGDALAVHLNITGERLSRILQRQRNLTGRERRRGDSTSCSGARRSERHEC